MISLAFNTFCSNHMLYILFKTIKKAQVQMVKTCSRVGPLPSPDCEELPVHASLDDPYPGPPAERQQTFVSTTRATSH